MNARFNIYFHPLLTIVSLIIIVVFNIAGCTENVVYVNQSPDFMQLQYAEPGYGWQGSRVHVIGTNIQADSAVYKAFAGNAEAEILQIGKTFITIRIPDSANGDFIRIERIAGSGFSSVSVEFDLLLNTFPYNRVQLQLNPLYARSEQITTSDQSGVDSISSIEMLVVQHEWMNSGREERMFCRELSNLDTVRICSHIDRYSVDSRGKFYDQSDNMMQFMAVVDTVNRVLSHVEMSVSWWNNTQRAPLDYNSSQNGRKLIVHDVPFTILPDGSLEGVLAGQRLRSNILEFNEAESVTSRSDSSWSSRTSTVKELMVSDTTELRILLSHRDNL
jgi:hypothetical protein